MKAKVLALLVTSLISASSMAVSIDYRHEMKDTANGSHADRLLISNRFDNGFGLSMEGKWKQSSKDTTTNQPFSEPVSNGTEVTASYLYKFDKTFSVEAGLNMVTTSGVSSSNTGTTSNAYRPYIKGYANITDSLYYALRYRPSYTRYSSNIGTSNPTDMTGYAITSTLGYKLPANFTIEYEYEYVKNTKAGSFGYITDKDSDNMTHDVKLSYKVDKNWTPYVQVANVEQDTTTDHRQTRYRVGVQYNF